MSVKMSDNLPISELCNFSIEGTVGHITMARSEVFNALNAKLISELISILNWSSERSAGSLGTLVDEAGSEFLRVITLAGEGKHFCAGADINMMRDAGAKSDEENRQDSERLDNLFNSLWAHPCFTITSVQGVALGGGAGLIACSDHVIGQPSTRIALSEGKLGILPAVIGPYVYRRVGSAQFRRLAMLAGQFDATEALNIGMIDQVADSPAEATTMVEEAISTVLTTGPSAVYEAKKLTLKFDRFEGTDEELRLWTLDKTSEMRGSNEGQEGLSSFLDRRKPTWYHDEN
jgi:methylglutaconyl-CoA hydratase